jgi:hypothetical protein
MHTSVGVSPKTFLLLLLRILLLILLLLRLQQLQTAVITQGSNGHSTLGCLAEPSIVHSLLLCAQTWYYDCNQWFDAARGDRLIERVLRPSLQVHLFPNLSVVWKELGCHSDARLSHVIVSDCCLSAAALLLSWGVMQNPRASKTTYLIKVVTGTLTGSGTDARVYIELRGKSGASSGKQVSYWLNHT